MKDTIICFTYPFSNSHNLLNAFMWYSTLYLSLIKIGSYLTYKLSFPILLDNSLIASIILFLSIVFDSISFLYGVINSLKNN